MPVSNEVMVPVPPPALVCGNGEREISINSTSRKARAWARPRGDMVALGPSAFIFLSHHGMEEGRCFTVMECYGRPPMLNYASK